MPKASRAIDYRWETGVAEAVSTKEEGDVLRAWGVVIRRYRQWKSLTRRELATRAGISPVYLGEIERGQKDSSSHSLQLIADALEVPLGELFLRVASELGTSRSEGESDQPVLPLAARESSDGYLEAVSLARDETAYDLYKVARLLRSDQQVSLLLLARSLSQRGG